MSQKEIIPPKSENDPLDLDAMLELEIPAYIELKNKIKQRDMFKASEDHAKEQRSLLDEEIKKFMYKYNFDTLILGDQVISRVISRSGGKYDKVAITRMLTPDQLDEVYTEGSQYDYVGMKTDEKRVEKIRDQLAEGWR